VLPRRLGRAATTLLVACGLVLAAWPGWAQNQAAPPSLKRVPVPEPNNLGLFLRSQPNNLNVDGFPVPTPAARKAAIALGKALFWDMQVGSDGVQACASCHFHAGADNRTKNQIDPGLRAVDPSDLSTPDPDHTFQVVGPNGTLTAAMFPFHRLADPDDRYSAVLSDANDVCSSQGVRDSTYMGLSPSGVEYSSPLPDPDFTVGSRTVRRAEPRNAPSMINAVFNYENFWDGRASHTFNGSSPFGDADPDAGVWVNVGGTLQKRRVQIPMSSLASQAVGPPGSNFEMSYDKRNLWDIGRKLLASSVVPLGKQNVHPRDSVLGPLARSTVGATGQPVWRRGLNTTYAALIKAAFNDTYWGSSQTVTLTTQSSSKKFSQMEANFSLFFGLAIQLYEATLVSDDTPFDRFQEGDVTAMSWSAQQGLDIFLTDVDVDVAGGSCINCHAGSEFTGASVSHIGSLNPGDPFPEGVIQLMAMGDGGDAFYDSGYYDIGLRPIADDLGRGGTVQFGNATYPLSFTERALTVANGGSFPFDAAPLPCGLPGTPSVCPAQERAATAGAFKTPGLRNIELTGPYDHTGSLATLRQVVDFYTRGGDFSDENLATLDPDIQTNPVMAGDDDAKNALVDFLLALTDERVRWEEAPFDHPELFIPNGSPGGTTALRCATGEGTSGSDGSCDTLMQIPAVGASGRSAEHLAPLGTFLDLDPHHP
jgi:cytochrome c peroxidase